MDWCLYPDCEAQQHRTGLCQEHLDVLLHSGMGPAKVKAARAARQWQLSRPPAPAEPLDSLKGLQEEPPDPDEETPSQEEAEPRKEPTMSGKLTTNKGATCKEEGCGEPAYCKGLCKLHYGRANYKARHAGGKTSTRRPRRSAPEPTATLTAAPAVPAGKTAATIDLATAQLLGATVIDPRGQMPGCQAVIITPTRVVVQHEDGEAMVYTRIAG